MAFQINTDTDPPSLLGLTANPQIRAPLGRLYSQTSNGHFVGIDDRFIEPVVMRAYWDPSDTRIKAVPPVGYVQFMQIRYAETSIPPAIFSAHLADRHVYATARNAFIDFMGPADVVVRWDEQVPIFPWYAWNTALRHPVNNWRELVSYRPDVNGLFYTNLTTGPPETQVKGPTITAEVPAGLLTSDHIGRLLRRRPPDLTLSPSPQQAAIMTPYEMVLDYYRQPNGQLVGIANDQLIARAIGDYVLIEIPDDEDMGPTLCIRAGRNPADQSPAVYTWILRFHELQSVEHTAITQALWRMADYVGLQEVEQAMEQDAPPRQSRGQTGLEAALTPPPNQPVEFRYWTWVMGVAIGNRYVPISGFTWSAIMSYLPDERTLDLTDVAEPTPQAHFDLEDAMSVYRDAIERVRTMAPNDRPTIDTSNFTLAIFERANFGGGRQLRLRRNPQ